MPPKSEPLSTVTRGEKAGRLAMNEMIKTASSETGGLQGVMRRLEAVGDIVAEEYRQAGMPSVDVRSWRVGFQSGIGQEFSEYMRRLRKNAFGPAV